MQLPPKFGGAFIERAHLHLEKGDYDEAIADYTKAIDLDPTRSDAYDGRAAAFERKNDLSAALVDSNQSIRLSPNYAQAWFNRAIVFGKLRKDRERLADLLKAKELAPKWSNISNDLAWLLVTSPQDDIRDSYAACDYIAEALEAEPDNPGFWDTCAAVFAIAGTKVTAVAPLPMTMTRLFA